MKKTFFYIALCLSLALVSCGSGIEKASRGFWVNQDNDHYLWVDDDVIHMAYLSSKRKTALDYNGVVALFEKSVKEDVDPENHFSPIYLNAKRVDKVKKENEWDNADWEKAKAKFMELYLAGADYYLLADRIQFVSEYFFVSPDASSIIIISSDYYDESTWYSESFRRIDEPESLRNTKRSNGLFGRESAWKSLFDENDIVVFDTGIRNTRYKVGKYYLIMHAYSFSDEKTEGKATVCLYEPEQKKDNLWVECHFRYVLHDGQLSLIEGEFKGRKDWVRIREEIILSFDPTQQTLSGDFRFDNGKPFNISAPVADFDYSRWEWQRVF